MAEVRELPQLVREFVDMSKEYMRQETLGPAKRLGQFAGFSIGAAVAFALGALFWTIALLRIVRDLLPDGPNWSALGYIIMAVLLAAIAGLLVSLTNRRISRSQ